MEDSPTTNEPVNDKSGDKKPEILTNSDSDQFQTTSEDKNPIRDKTSNVRFRNFLKKFRDHLFDFILLFLAVFCGFLADNHREEMSERQREEIFIRSLVEDIISDTIESNKTLERLRMMNTGLDSVLVALSDPETIENSNKVFQLWTKNLGLEIFVSNDRTIQQLKSNGELRLIRNKEVSDRIMKYDQTLKKYYTQSNLMYSALTNLTYYSQLFDFIRLSRNDNEPVPITEQGKNSLNQAYSHLFLWNRGLSGLISYLDIVNNEGKELVIFIQEQYNLDK